MEIVTSWMEQGLEQGALREKSLVLRQLTRRLGNLPPSMQSQVSALPLEQVESLGEALLDFVGLTDLERWLSGR
jgi:hypothetical protein